MTVQHSRTPELTLEQLNERLEALERERLALTVSPRWWQDHAGRFQDDRAFDEIVKLGRKSRKVALKKPGRASRAGTGH
jgi:hypothetical protein